MAKHIDGAANMNGKFKGLQSRILGKQPLAQFMHCSAHMANLAAAKVTESSIVISSTLSVANALGCLLANSGKCCNVFKRIAKKSGSRFSIRPLCPTRWLVKVEYNNNEFR